MRFDLASKSEKYVELKGNLGSLYAQERDLEREGQKLAAEFRAIDDQRRQRGGLIIDGTGSDDNISDLLSDSQPSRTAHPALAEATRMDEIRTRLGEINHQKDRLKRAQDITKDELARERIRVSEIVCDEVRVEYAAHVRAIAEKLLELAETEKAYRRLTSQLQSNDIAWAALIPLATPLGDPRSAHSETRRWFRRAIEAGYVDRRAMEELAK